MRGRIERVFARVWGALAIAAGALAIVAGAVVLRIFAGVGFANYDTLYALAWGGQLSRGQTPAYGVAIAPTPHPLVEALGVALSPLSARAIEDVAVALAFLALSACAWVMYRLASLWFGRAAGVVAAVILLTRVPILSYGARAYVDIPYMLLVLAALLVESRRRAASGRSAANERPVDDRGQPGDDDGPTEAGREETGPDGTAGRQAGDRGLKSISVLALLALAGLLRPEAWAFSGLYWLYLMDLTPARLGRLKGFRRARVRARASEPSRRSLPRGGARIAGLTLLAAAAPVLWVASDWLITGDPLWSLTNTRHTAHMLGRVTGVSNVPQYVPRRIGEILRPPVLAGAALGGVLSLLWLRRRALLAAAAGAIAVAVFAAFAAAGLPINTRYAFLASAILCVFCGAGAFGWTRLAREDTRRRWWMAGGALVLVALALYAPAQYRSAHRELDKLARQQRIQNDLLALVHDRAITLTCGPVGVPNHAPVPLLALYLKTSPANVVSAQTGQVSQGVYVDPASKEVEDDYVLDPLDPHLPVTVPSGFTEAHANRSWLIFRRC